MVRFEVRVRFNVSFILNSSVMNLRLFLGYWLGLWLINNIKEGAKLCFWVRIG